MSERKVLTKYYPPDFDPSKIQRVKGPKPTGPKLQTVRLMAPFSMKCTACGEYIYKGRKFNARKETTDMKYYAIPIYRFYIKCTRCSGEITFRTDPKNMDYECEKGAKRNFEPWREAKLAEETEEERLDRLEREEAERDAMKDLEKKTVDARTEMQIADALDEIRVRNARNERVTKDGDGVVGVEVPLDEERARLEQEDEEAAKRAFLSATGEKVRRLVEIQEEDEVLRRVTAGSVGSSGPPSASNEQASHSNAITPDTPISANPTVAKPTFQRSIKKKKDFGAALGIKKKPALV